MPWRRWMPIAAVAIMVPVAASRAPASPVAVANGTLLSREAYRFPFATRDDAWLAFVAGTAGGTEADHARRAAGTATTTERIACRSGGL